MLSFARLTAKCVLLTRNMNPAGGADEMSQTPLYSNSQIKCREGSELLHQTMWPKCKAGNTLLLSYQVKLANPLGKSILFVIINILLYYVHIPFIAVLSCRPRRNLYVHTRIFDVITRNVGTAVGFLYSISNAVVEGPKDVESQNLDDYHLKFKQQYSISYVFK